MSRFAGVLTLTVVLASCITYGDRDRLRIDDFRDFESWSLVTPEPLVGAANGPLAGRHLEEDGMREVYVNSTAQAFFRSARELPFPEGSIIVKDTHYIDRDGGRGRRWNITVMRKRESGYDPANNDWEYVTAGPTKFIRVQGRAALCIDCHVAARSNDFVFTWPE